MTSSLCAEDIRYEAAGTALKGYLAYDEQAKGRRPGVLVVHEWWGQNEFPRKRARMLAEMGYTALALDMFGDGKTADNPDDAAKLATGVMQNWEDSKARFLAALDLLKSHSTVDPQRIAVIGFCFGGGVALQMAREGAALDAVVSFHGSLATEHPAQPGGVKAKLLVLHGGSDPFVNDEQLIAFKNEMEQAGADYRIVVYGGARHAFTNPDATGNGEKFGLPLAYNETADRKSWQEMAALFGQLFGQ